VGLLVDGTWHDQWYDTASTGGAFQRSAAQFCRHISADGPFTPAPGRYHLYVSLACPWAHRTLIFRQLKGLESLIDVTIVSPDMLQHGWQFATPDPLYGFNYAHQLYTKANPHYSGRVTVPILWDKEQETIVSNESADIIRMFNFAFNEVTGNDDDYYPAVLRGEIDRINDVVYHGINNGVYRCGFATTQTAYNEAFDALFATLDEVDQRLSQQRYLIGDRITEADWRLFTTLIRFDPVYVGHFKCNQQRIADYPHISHYLRELYQFGRVRETVNLTHIKQHYYGSHESINPTRIVACGPQLDWDEPHNRAALGATS